MISVATTRKIGELISDVKEGKLIPRPKFQRRLVWRNDDKIRFLDSVVRGYPFPEIYVAAGKIDIDTAKTVKELVDGQQRVTTLVQYFDDSDLIKTEGFIKYSQLSPEEKEKFLEYVVVVRDLGRISEIELKETFKRLNATNYGLNDYEKQNAEFSGEFKMLSIEISEYQFFEDNRIFTANDLRRMQDAQYVSAIIATVMSDYFSLNTYVEQYLERYNEEFEEKDKIKESIKTVLESIESMKFGQKSRVWNKSDLFTLIVELYRYIIVEDKKITNEVKRDIKRFYEMVSIYAKNKSEAANGNIVQYHTDTLQGANNRDRRLRRGDLVNSVLRVGLDKAIVEKAKA